MQTAKVQIRLSIYLASRPRWLSRMCIQLEIRRSWVWSPPGLASFFCGDWSWNKFYCHSLSSPDSRRTVVSFWQKNCTSTGYAGKVWLGKLSTLSMTLIGWLGCKTSTQSINQFIGSVATGLKQILSWFSFDLKQTFFQEQSVRNWNESNVLIWFLSRGRTWCPSFDLVR